MGHPTTGSSTGMGGTSATSSLPGNTTSTSSSGTHPNLASELAAGHSGAGLSRSPQGSSHPQNPFFSAGTSSVHTEGPHQSELPDRSVHQPALGSTQTGSGLTSHEGIGTGNHPTSGHGNEPSGVSTTDQGSHFGRDAAIGSGVAGSLSSFEHQGSQGHNQHGLGSGGVHYGSSSGSHQTAIANILDPNLNSTSRTGTESAHTHDHKHGGGAEEADTHHKDTGNVGRSAGLGQSTSSTSHDPVGSEVSGPTSAGHHNVARDGAMGPAGAGLIGHEMGKDYPSHSSHTPGMDSTSRQGVESTSSGQGLGTQPGTSGTGIRPRTGGLIGHPTGTSSQEPLYARDNDPSSHTARNVGLGAGAVGAAGLAGHEYGKERDPTHSNVGSTTQPSASVHDNTSSSEHGVFGGHDSSHSSTTHASTEHHDSSTSKHHPGEKAGVAAGGAALAEHEREGHRSSTTSSTTGPAPNTSGPHKHDCKFSFPLVQISSLTALGLNKLDPRVDHKAGISDESTSKTTDDKHHSGRDAAIAGGAGTAAYKFDEKHHGHRVTDPNDSALTEADFDAQGKRITHARSNAEPALEKLEATVPGHGTHGHERIGDARETPAIQGHHDSHHKGSAAAVGAGALAGEQAATHRHGNSNPATDRGFAEADTDQMGRPISHAHSQGAAGLASQQSTLPQHQHQHETVPGVSDTRRYTETDTGPDGRPIQGARSNAPAALSSIEHGPSHSATEQSSHTGRDAAALGTAGVVAEHEQQKHTGTHPHDKEVAGQVGQTSYSTPHDPATQYGRKHEGLVGASSTPHSSEATHPGRDVTASTGGATALESHEGRGKGFSPSDAGIGSSGYDNTTSGMGYQRTADDSHGHTKLHKEPPMGVQQELAGGHGSGGGMTSGVPRDAGEREGMLREGERDVHGDTGVANARAAGTMPGAF